MNPWLARRPLHFAHQGGELEAPSNTMFAFRTAVAKGAHALEMDVHATADGEIVVSHDPDAGRCTDGDGAYRDLRLEEVKALDAAYWFVPGRDAVRDAPDYPLRGLERDDLRVPTLREVLDAFPDVYLNMDLKGSGYEATVAALLDSYGRADDVIVASFSDETIATFRATAPGVSTAAGSDETRALWGRDAELPASVPYEAMQVPWEMNGRELVTAERLRRAEDAGVAVHVWTVDDEATMRRLLDLGVHGIMTARPTLLARVLSS